LLPCSVIISLTQSANNYDLIESKKNAIFFIIPAMVVSLTAVIVYNNSIDISKIIGSFLLLTGAIKLSSNLQHYLYIVMKKHLQLYYLFIGFVHGASNMGGGPLSIFMSTVHTDKEQVRTNIAFIYLILALFQLIVLFVIDASNVKYLNVALVLIALTVYSSTNRFLSSKINNGKYTSAINVLILIYGVLAIIK
jgi:hypothetical protein